MIIKTHGIRTGTTQRVLEYVVAQGDNEEVVVLEDASEALLDADLFARIAGHKNGVLHITISPDRNVCTVELKQIVAAISDEFGLSKDHPALLVRHVSKRSSGDHLPHFHMIRPAADANGKVFDLYRSKKRDEAVSRFLELELGHKVTPGKHSDFVHERFLERRLPKYAEKIAPLLNAKPEALVSRKEHQKAKRTGYDAVQFAKSLKEVAELPRGSQPKAFAKLLVRHGDLEIAQGNRASRLLVKKRGEVLCNANRHLKLAAMDVKELIDLTKREICNEQGYRQGASVAAGNGSEARTDARNARGHVEARASGGRKINTRVAGNSGFKSASDHRRQSHHQGKLGCAGQAVRRPQDKPVIQEMTKVAAAIEAMVTDLKAAQREYCAHQTEPMPDLDDPFLMMKLSRQLHKSLGLQPTF